MLQIIQLSAYVFAGARTTECTVQKSDLRIVLLWNITIRGSVVCLLSGTSLGVVPISIFLEICLAGSLLSEDKHIQNLNENKKGAEKTLRSGMSF